SRASPIAATATTSSTPVTTGQPGGRRPLVTLDDATAGGVVVGGVAPSGVDGGGAVAPGLAVDRGAGPTRFASELVGSGVISAWARAVVPLAGQYDCAGDSVAPLPRHAPMSDAIVARCDGCRHRVVLDPGVAWRPRGAGASR